MVISTTLQTGFGAWDPVIWLTAFVVAFIIAALIWRMGEKSPRTSGEAVRPFISGNAEPAKSDVHVRGGNLYWGFTEALRGYYDWLAPLHSGILSDYLLWYLGVTAIALILIVGVVR